MKVNRFWYCILYGIARAGLFFWHPVFRVTGRENIPDGPCLICCNHRGLADPIWVIVAMRQRKFFRIMAKDELLHLPLLGTLLRWIGIIGVRRGESDIGAVKTALRALKDGEKVLIFPEGTRAVEARLEGKTGAALLALRTGCPVLPVYLQRRRHPFSVLRAAIGPAYRMETEGAKPTAADMRNLTDELMDRIYALGEEIG